MFGSLFFPPRRRSMRCHPCLALFMLCCLLVPAIVNAADETWGSIKARYRADSTATTPDLSIMGRGEPESGMQTGGSDMAGRVEAVKSDSRFAKLSVITGVDLELINVGESMFNVVPADMAGNSVTTITIMPAGRVLYVLKDVGGVSTAHALVGRTGNLMGPKSDRAEPELLIDVYTVSKTGTVVHAVSPFRCFLACAGAACGGPIMRCWYLAPIWWQLFVACVGGQCAWRVALCALGCF